MREINFEIIQFCHSRSSQCRQDYNLVVWLWIKVWLRYYILIFINTKCPKIQNTNTNYKLQNTKYKIVHLIWKYLPNIALAGPVLHVEDPRLLLPITHLDLLQSSLSLRSWWSWIGISHSTRGFGSLSFFSIFFSAWSYVWESEIK